MTWKPEQRAGPDPVAIVHAYESGGEWLARLYRTPKIGQLEEAGRALVRLGNRLCRAGPGREPECPSGPVATAEVVLRKAPDGGLTAEVGPLAPTQRVGAGQALVALGQRLRASAATIAKGTGRFPLPPVPRPRPMRR